MDVSMSASMINGGNLNRKTANLGGLGKAHAAPGNLEDLIDSTEDKPTSRVFDALDKVNPDDDKVDAMTYARIVHAPCSSNLNNTMLERVNQGNTGLSA